jgi:hypothetical protein
MKIEYPGSYYTPPEEAPEPVDMDQVEEAGILIALEGKTVTAVVEHFYRGRYSKTELVEQLMKHLHESTRVAEQMAEDGEPWEGA